MSNTEMSSKVKELRQLKRMADELTAEIEALTDSIKAEMTAQGVDTLTGTDYKVMWKSVTGSRLDGKALKAAMPDLYERFTTPTQQRRFTLA